MVRTVSVINLKGGVGKTTITIALAEFLAEEEGKRVLVIDLDPQTNATVALIPQQNWEQLDRQGLTLFQMFSDVMSGTQKFQMHDSIVRNVSNVNGGISGLDLFPSSLRLIDIQDDLTWISQKTRHTLKPFEVLKEMSKDIIPTYDYVIIDCPPNLGLITQNGLRISDAYLIPTIPDILSTLGIPQINEKTKRFEKDWQKSIVPLGIVLSKVRPVGLHLREEARLRSRQDYRVFETVVKEAVRTGEAMASDITFASLRSKYGYGTYFDVYNSLKEEFMRVCDESLK